MLKKKLISHAYWHTLWKKRKKEKENGHGEWVFLCILHYHYSQIFYILPFNTRQ